jgi:RNA polymerase sigma-32 factor
MAFLTREQEQELAYRWRDHRDESAMHQLVMAYQPLVSKVAKRFKSIPFADAMQEGTIGLMIAAQRFEPQRGLRFGTFAQWWVRAQITAALFLESTVKQSQSVKAKKAFFQGQRGVKTVSLELQVNGAQTLGEVLVDPAPLPDELVEDLDRQRHTCRLKSAMRKLDKRSREVLEARWLAEEPVTLEVLGAIYGVSKERIRQIEAAALERVKQYMLNPRSNKSQGMASARATVRRRLLTEALA